MSTTHYLTRTGVWMVDMVLREKKKCMEEMVLVRKMAGVKRKCQGGNMSTTHYLTRTGVWMVDMVPGERRKYMEKMMMDKDKYKTKESMVRNMRELEMNLDKIETMTLLKTRSHRTHHPTQTPVQHHRPSRLHPIQTPNLQCKMTPVQPKSILTRIS